MEAHPDLDAGSQEVRAAHSRAYRPDGVLWLPDSGSNKPDLADGSGLDPHWWRSGLFVRTIMS